jgi:GGDEF domain-containing protein
MTLGGSELQVFVTFLVILACAFVALLMDYLKGNNEQLRERHVDLLVRQEQYAGKASVDAALLARSLEQVLGEQTEAIKAIVSKPHASTLRELPVWEIPEPRREAPAEAVLEADKVKISLIPETKVAPPPPPETTPEAPQTAAVAPPIANVVPIRPVQEAPVPEKPSHEPAPAAANADPGEKHDFDRFLDDLVTEFESNPAAYPEPVFEDAPAAPEDPEEEDLVQAAAPSTAEQLVPLAAAVESTPKGLPAGVHPAAVLSDALGTPARLSGIVVSVGINDYSNLHKNLGQQAAEQLLGSVDSLMQELVRGKAFLCRKAEDEFILIEPDLTGAFAQRRLNEISERLWDFQLRNLGSFSVVFSWGAHEAHDEKISEAVDAAHERMNETKLARKNSAFEKTRRRLATA